MAADPIPFHNPTASDAWHRIEAHERVCAERYGNLTVMVKDHREDAARRFDEINRGVTRIIWTMAGGMVAIIAYLLTLHVPGLKP